MTAILFPEPRADVLARRDFLIAGLAKLVPPASLVTSEDERRAFETDAFTAYRRVPLAVVLPETTAEVSAVLAFCHQHQVPVVPRGAGTSLCGGAIPQEDAVVIGLSKMTSRRLNGLFMIFMAMMSVTCLSLTLKVRSISNFHCSNSIKSTSGLVFPVLSSSFCRNLVN